MRLKDISILTPQYTGKPLDTEVSFVPMESLRNGSIDLKEIPYKDAKGKYTFFGNGDLLIAKVTPCFENGNIAIAENLKEEIGFGSSEIFVLRFNKKALNTYMFYVSQSAKFQDAACATMCGVGGLKRISPLFMKTYELDIPTIFEQQRIVNYLDEKTKAIDGRISVLEKKSDAYTRLKASVINRAVTRGLTPNVPLKDSGIEWIGMIPEHWEVKRVKDIYSRIFMGKSPVYELEIDNENYIFGQKNNQSGYIDLSGLKMGKDSFYQERQSYEFLKYGDVLLNTLGGGSVGRAGYFDYNGDKKMITDGHVMVIRTKDFLSKFLYFYLHSRRKELENMAVGSTNQAFFNISDILPLHIPCPTYDEQKEISDYLDTKCSEIDKAIDNIGKQIDALKRLKRSLINEVVTGKRKI